MGQIDLLKNSSYSIGPNAKRKKKKDSLKKFKKCLYECDSLTSSHQKNPRQVDVPFSQSMMNLVKTRCF